MISVDEALERILSYVGVLEPEEKRILAALGQVLTEDVIAPFNIPPMDNSAMDGYALQAASTTGASRSAPMVLRVVGELAAGYVFEGEVTPGTAVRIMTGASVPRGADTVVPFEETEESVHKAPTAMRRIDERVHILREARVGSNIRRAGEDIREGQRVLAKGIVLRPAEVGLLASIGRTMVKVVRRPVVAVLSTGDELVEMGQPLPPGRIYDSNVYSLAALIDRYGGIPKVLGIARDTVEALVDKIHQGLDADMLLTSAGVSRGDYDMVKDVLAREGEIDFWTAAMKPGKPLAFGLFRSGQRRIPHIGLPGNPVSSMVSFELFARPAILKMMGKTHWQKPTIRAIAKERIVNRGDPRRYFARCVVTEEGGRYYASLTGPQGSGILSSMAAANALTVIPEDVDVVEPGEEITVMMLDWSQGEEWGTA
ncbi:MAG: molybdopterin molybdotransferase MoeA [Dehalococcoidia bacterium]|nr:MAG: molybdopterin molybdotransferase MoeA [Dehalococcoidia bacterium]